MYCMQFKNKLVWKLFLLFLQNSFWGCPVIWPDIKGHTLLQVKFPVFTPHATNVLSKGGCGRHRREMPCERFGVFVLLISSTIDHVSLSFIFSDSTDRKSTRLNSSHQIISYAVFCLKKKKYNS